MCEQIPQSDDAAMRQVNVQRLASVDEADEALDSSLDSNPVHGSCVDTKPEKTHVHVFNGAAGLPGSDRNLNHALQSLSNVITTHADSFDTRRAYTNLSTQGYRGMAGILLPNRTDIRIADSAIAKPQPPQFVMRAFPSRCVLEPPVPASVSIGKGWDCPSPRPPAGWARDTLSPRKTPSTHQTMDALEVIRERQKQREHHLDEYRIRKPVAPFQSSNSDGQFVAEPEGVTSQGPGAYCLYFRVFAHSTQAMYAQNAYAHTCAHMMLFDLDADMSSSRGDRHRQRALVQATTPNSSVLEIPPARKLSSFSMEWAP